MSQIVFREADNGERELVKLLAHRLLVEDAQYGVFAVDGRHDRDAEVDLASFVAHTKTPVLGNPVFGNVELRHDLDARDDRLVPVSRDRWHGIVQYTIDAAFDGDFVAAGLDVDVAGPAFEGVEDRCVDQAYDGADVRVARQLLDRDRFVTGCFLPHDVQDETLGNLF